jgi:phosphopantetheinyl transferase
MDVVLYAARCREGEEHDCAYRLLSLLLRRERGIEKLPEIAYGWEGKPYFPGHKDLHFSLSHSHGAAVCALHHRPIGVDIELLRSAPRRLAQGMDDGAFFRSWTGREATVKRRGGSIVKVRGRVVIDPYCRWLEDALPGWIVAVCPSCESAIKVYTDYTNGEWTSYKT